MYLAAFDKIYKDLIQEKTNREELGFRVCGLV
jgi:hypothetical protein